MTVPTTYPSTNKNARMAGLWYLVLAICGAFAEFFVRQGMTVPGDAAATAENILAAPTLFRLGIGVELLGQVAFVLLVLALYDILKAVNRRRALLMVALVVVAVAVTSLNMVNQFGALLVLDGTGPLAGVMDAAQREALSLTFIDLHHIGYSVVAQVFFGLWLLPLGLLVYRSGFLPRLVGVFLVIAGLGYLADVALLTLVPDSTIVLSEFTFVGELMLMLWLLIRGAGATNRKPQPVTAIGAPAR